MPRCEQRVQRKLAARKRKQRRASKVLLQRKQQLASLAGIIKCASNGKTVECTIGDSWSVEDSGMITVSLVRSAPRGQVVWACFMVDLWCLGVKDCFAKLVPTSSYYRYKDEMSDRINIRQIGEDVGHAIVAGGIGYAHSLGLDPHPDCHKIMPIWQEIPIGKFPDWLEFGRNSRPCYIVGPYDDHQRQSYISRVLNEATGEGEFDMITASQQFASPIGAEFHGDT